MSKYPTGFLTITLLLVHLMTKYSLAAKLPISTVANSFRIYTGYLIISSHLSLNLEGRWGTTDDFTTSFLHFSLFSTAFWDLANSRPVHSLMSSHLFFCLPCLLPPFTVPCKMVLARPNERQTLLYHCSLRLSTIVRRSWCGPIAC